MERTQEQMRRLRENLVKDTIYELLILAQQLDKMDWQGLEAIKAEIENRINKTSKLWDNLRVKRLQVLNKAEQKKEVKNEAQ
jgi:hypothetical protein